MENEFYLMLYRAFHAQRHYLRPKAAKIGLGTGQPKILSYLSQNGRSSQREIADYFEIDPAAVCRMIDLMQKSGMISTQPDDADRRSDVISLTEKGRSAGEKWKLSCDEAEKIMLQGFSDDEKKQFADFLVRSYRNLRIADDGSEYS
ncbi:MAG TPA: MarR family transcriptional regulator [Firmicutes bacterium]|nr:MarR family transcriptional regulator [Bacillota bacterium]